jgi:AraC-like DNA-binding protein
MTHLTSEARLCTLPGVHALHLVEVVARWQVTPAELLSPLGLDTESLGDPHARLEIPVVEELARRAYALTGEPALGVYLGLSMRASAHGYLGFAAMSAATVGEALELAARFTPTRTSALALHLCVDGEVASLVLEERADLGAARELIVFALLVGLWQIGRTLTGRELDGSADIAFARPRWFGRFAERVRIRFAQPLNQLVFPTSTLRLPLGMADAAALRLARAECERELEALRESTAGRVRRVLARERGGFRDLPQVAKLLFVSTRTLKRRLAAEGVQFSQILDEERRAHALMLLHAPDRSLDEIADRLGYSDLANFTRAFRRWTGKTPGAFRRSR